MSVDSICQFIDNSEKYTHEMVMKIQNDLKCILSDVMSEEDFDIKVVEHWVEFIDKNDDLLPLNILMPYTKRKLKDRFTQAIESQYAGNIVFEFHNEPRFVFKYKSRLAEFYPQEFIDSTVNALTSKYISTERQIEISMEAIRYLNEQISQRYLLSQRDDIEGLTDE